MPRLALVTYAAAPALTRDDRLLQEALLRRGAAVDPVVWDDQDVEWSGYDLVLLRSTWDYHLRPDEFAEWIGRLDGLGITLVNTPAVLRWNLDKRYLLDLEQDGVQIVPSELLLPDNPRAVSLQEILHRRGWSDAVVKPAVSAGAHDTWRTALATSRDDQSRFEVLRQRARAGVLVQRFMQEVLREGEWSLVFLDGEFSHAAVKRSRDGDFRVQQEHGGSYAPATALATIKEDAGRVIAAGAARAGVARADLAYARVDGVVQLQEGQARLVLMELECLEPSLFFLQAPAAAEWMAQSLLTPRWLHHRTRV